MYLPNVILYQYNNDLNNRDQTGGREFAANFSYICLINHNYIILQQCPLANQVKYM